MLCMSLCLCTNEYRYESSNSRRELLISATTLSGRQRTGLPQSQRKNALLHFGLDVEISWAADSKVSSSLRLYDESGHTKAIDVPPNMVFV
mmetsp:Transcript_33538/g.49485  ORF Transcript_33538/g.49485 Transcript_33538/m.49485 type:complete len:91 (+) Transcript_33538:404-676(+)